MSLCKDCKFAEYIEDDDSFGNEEWECVHPKQVSPVNGAPASCWTVRASKDPEDCGRGGRWFESRKLNRSKQC